MLKRLAGYLLRRSSRAAIWLGQFLVDLDTYINTTQQWSAIRDRSQHPGQ